MPSSFKSRCKKEETNLHSFIVASFNAQSVKGNDMAGKPCEISTFIKDNGVDLFFMTETWLSAQGDEAKTVELAPSEFDVKSFHAQINQLVLIPIIKYYYYFLLILLIPIILS